MIVIRITAYVEVSRQHEIQVSEALHVTIDRLALDGVPIFDSSVICEYVFHEPVGPDSE